MEQKSERETGEIEAPIIENLGVAQMSMRQARQNMAQKGNFGLAISWNTISSTSYKILYAQK